MREIKLGIRVENVAEAAGFYSGLGFRQIATIPGPDSAPVLSVMILDGFHLIVDALQGLPFPDTERERRIQSRPRGLGCVIGLEVPDLQATWDYCLAQGCDITSPILDTPWGERIFTCLDPWGYEWKLAVKKTAVNELLKIYQNTIWPSALDAFAIWAVRVAI